MSHPLDPSEFPEDPSGLILHSHEGGVGTITLNRPDKKNALNGKVLLALTAAMSRYASSNKIHVIALRGAGADFCAGADLAELAQLQEMDTEINLKDAMGLGRLLIKIRDCPKPVVAVVQGRALAGGAGLASACDLVLAHENAELGYPEVHLGFVPAMVMAILRRKVGESRAFELAVRGDRISAAEAERIGLVNKVFPADTFEADVSAYLSSLASRPASAVKLTKGLLYGIDGLPFDQAIARGAEVNVIARLTDACRQGVRAFLERSRR